jgi:competence protein ComEC
VVDVGQGAAALVRSGAGNLALIDSGPPGGAESLLVALARHGQTAITVAIHTHFDADHVGGIARVMAGGDGRPGTADDVTLHFAYDRGFLRPPATWAVALYAFALGDRRVDVLEPRRIQLDDVTFRVRPPAPITGAGENDRGLTVCVDLPGLRLFAPGDRAAADVLADARACGAGAWLWVPHHGSADAGLAALVAALQPVGAIVSAGHDNGYCHPAPEVISTLAGIPTYLIDAAGLAASGPCAALAPAFGEHVRWIAGDLWLPAGGP